MRTDWIYGDLAALRDYLRPLDQALIPGTARRYHQRDLSDAERARQNALAVAERQAKELNIARGIKSLGDAPAPLSISVLDARDMIAMSVRELEEATCDVLELTPLANPTTAERIRRIVDLLDRIAYHDDLFDHVRSEAVRLRQAARVALGEGEPIVRLRARCSHCDAVSLRAFLERGVVVCVNSACQCNALDCPCQWDKPKRHTWPFERWPSLAANLREGIGVAE